MRLSLKERRMMFDNATNLYRKFGVAERRDLRCAIRVPQIYRSRLRKKRPTAKKQEAKKAVRAPCTGL